MHELKLKSLDIMDMDDFEREYFSQMINNTVAPFTTLSTIMFGGDDEEDSREVITIIIPSFIEEDNQNLECLFELLNNTIELVHNIKNQIREVFIESKKGQIVSYYAYGETGEVDFGSYTINNLD